MCQKTCAYHHRSGQKDVFALLVFSLQPEKHSFKASKQKNSVNLQIFVASAISILCRDSFSQENGLLAVCSIFFTNAFPSSIL